MEKYMNKETFEGKWNMLKGKAKEQWGKLTDDDLMRINGKKEQLIGKLQERYGFLKSRAEQEVANWEHTCSSCSSGMEGMEHHHNASANSHEEMHHASHMGKQNKMKQKH
jgi:uncharacterized protein YjbJ (UPF0337 family)